MKTVKVDAAASQGKSRGLGTAMVTQDIASSKTLCRLPCRRESQPTVTPWKAVRGRAKRVHLYGTLHLNPPN